MSRLGWGAVLPALLWGCAAGDPACAPQTTVALVTSGGPRTFAVSVARTAAERQRGLAGTAPLAPGRGLLLAFPTTDTLCIHNATVGYPIDAVFVGAGGAVVAVEAGIPAGDAANRCHGPADRVLEVAAGQATGATGPVSVTDVCVVPND